MSSLRLTTALQQKMVLTPQLRQRIEMLQMTSLELSELIEQELVANPILEEVLPGDEVQEISEVGGFWALIGGFAHRRTGSFRDLRKWSRVVYCRYSRLIKRSGKPRARKRI